MPPHTAVPGFRLGSKPCYSSNPSCKWGAVCLWGWSGVRAFTRVYVHHGRTLFAAHVAAPVELAFTFGDSADGGGVEPSSTTHDATPVRAQRGLVALPACSPQ